MEETKLSAEEKHIEFAIIKLVSENHNGRPETVIRLGQTEMEAFVKLYHKKREENYIISSELSEAKKEIESLNELNYKLHQSLLVVEQNLQSQLSDSQGLINRLIDERNYYMNESAERQKEIERLKEELNESDEVANKILSGQGRLYITQLESQLFDKDKEIDGYKKQWTINVQELQDKKHEIQSLNTQLSEMAEAKWISVNDKLPAFNGEYLVSVDPDDGDSPKMISSVADFWWGKWYYPASDKLEFNTVIFWQELPKPALSTLNKTKEEGGNV